jgi:GT2 family glycosyltransferase/glycosyltransferase involved in cell wall biosynthesis/tetratricopeptide (TPR) repeat protein
MRRPPATIVILAWNAWATTRACLDSLRPTLGVLDQVVVVDNGSTDATPAQLRRYAWAAVVTNDENLGFAAGCNRGAAAARHPVVVFLNNDTVLSGKWIDPLIAPLVDDTVGATGPRSNFVSGPQVAADATYAPGDTGAMRRFARSWAQSHRGQTTDVDRLVGFCLALRRDVFEEVGGFDESYGIGGFEDDDLCRRILASGRRLVIAHESFVHHEGHRTFDANGLDWFAEQESNRNRFEARHAQAPVGGGHLVSACIITKDEADNISACLASLDGLADEVVVYDTGSTDDTVAVARAQGATVVEGYWDDDFSRARNAALEHCQGQWIAWLDADETLVTADVDALRSLLRRADPDIDAFSVPIDNLTGTGAGSNFVHSACRLFRRSACEWVGRIHEQIARRADHTGIRQGIQDLARIHHTGYLESVMQSRNKVERNLRLATAEVEQASGWDTGFSLTSLGRSYLTAGRFDEAFEHCRRALEHSDNPITRRLALRSATESLLGLGRLDDALAWAGRLRAESGRPVLAEVLEGKIRVAKGELAAGLALLEQVGTSTVDDDGFEHAAHMYATVRAEALAGLGRPSDAADALLEALFDHGVLDAHLGSVVGLLEQSGRPLTDLARAITPDKATIFFAQLLQLRPEAADAVLEACLECHDDAQPVLATAATLAGRLPVERALVWSARLRDAGFADACPLIALARNDRSAPNRARAAAVALAAFGDERARPLFAIAMENASPAERESILAEATALCPAIVPDAYRPSVCDPGSSAPSATNAPGPEAAPRVSVVIPCFNHAELTLGCLQSLATHTAMAHEVIVVDNGSTDATRELAGLADDHFRVVRNEENLGFGPACNQGAAMARGEYVLFLNNDTVVSAGWLEPLVAALDEDPDRAAVQPKLVYPDGRLNDAGGLVFAGGEPWVYGKGDPDPDAPEFDCRRAPDYASGACLLVRRSAFAEVGGFDDRYAPAYFEDTDLSFSLRAAGWSVLYEPASTVIHVEGGTAGTDTSSGLKQYQVRNAERFAEKWASELAHRPPLDPALVAAWAHRSQGGFGPGERRAEGSARAEAWDRAVTASHSAKSILVIDPFMPVFDRASGSLRLFTLLRCLREAGHAVTFLPTTGGDRRYARAVGEFGITCYGADHEVAAAEQQAATRRYFRFVEDIVAERRVDVVLMSPWTVGELLLKRVRQAAPDALIILDTNDVHFRRLERSARLTGNAEEAMAAADTRRRELAVYRQADRIVCVTDDDADAVRTEIPAADIVVIPNAHGQVDPGPGFEARSGFVFVGNFNHPPNADAVAWWNADIAAVVAARLPGAGLTVVGNDPAGVAAAMAQQAVHVTGAVSSTLPYLHSARVSVAPLRYGAGMKGKVGEAMAAGLPVVVTTVAAEGMGLTDGEHVLVADTPEAFADAVVRLHTDADLWQRIRQAGREHVEEHFGVARMRAGVDAVLAPPRRVTAAVNRQARRQAQRRAATPPTPRALDGGRALTPADSSRAKSETPSSRPTDPRPPAPGQVDTTRARTEDTTPAPATGAGSRPTVALAMNTRNEAVKLAAALASAAGVDEIVVADMASTDDTVAIARAHGARIIDLPNAGYCEPGRQPLIDAVESEWILLLDADERLNAGGLEQLTRLAANTGPEVSAYLLPEVTLLGSTPIDGSGWGTEVELHPRFFRRADVSWPRQVHAVPSFTRAVVRLPKDVAVEIVHLNFDDLTHAFAKFNAYSAVEALERVEAGTASSWLSAFDDATAEFCRRYEPHTDGGVSLAMSFGLFFYRAAVHLKTLEADGTLPDAPMPAATSMARAWQAFRATLEHEEIAAIRAQIAHHLDAGDSRGAGAVLHQALGLWGVTTDLLVESAVFSAAVGAFGEAAQFCEQALALDPEHHGARVARLRVAVASGARPPVTAVVVGTTTAPLPGEVVVALPGESGGDVTAPADALPFEPGSLTRIRLPRRVLETWAPGARAGVLEAMRTRLAPGGVVEFVDPAPPGPARIDGPPAGVGAVLGNNADRHPS